MKKLFSTLFKPNQDPYKVGEILVYRGIHHRNDYQIFTLIVDVKYKSNIFDRFCGIHQYDIEVINKMVMFSGTLTQEETVSGDLLERLYHKPSPQEQRVLKMIHFL